jgi:hypothetical protein
MRPQIAVVVQTKNQEDARAGRPPKYIASRHF